MATATPNQERYDFATTGEHVIRHGEAAPIREPRQLNYGGRLDTPRLWLDPKKGQYAPLDATARVNFTEGSIDLTLLEKSELFDKASGSLVDSPELGLFKINTDTRYTLDELVTLLKRYRFFFPKKEQHLAILTALQTFTAKVETKIEQSRATNGSSKNNLEREVHGIEWERTFILSVPVFKGYAAESFHVEIGVDAASAGIRFYLESADLYELKQDLKGRLLATEIKYFEEWGCSLIYVS
jgi:hypothetical protein